jgi:TonB family protein
MGERDLRENPAILTHEQMHVRARHSVDLLLFLPLHLLMWWNPLVWITREELRLLHEYEADEGVIQKGIDATQYQLLLVRKAVGEQRFSLASGFKHANLKNRITMMLKPTSNRWMRLAYLALLPVLAVMMYACNPKKNQKAEPAAPAVTEETVQESVPYLLVETKPSFQGGGEDQFSKWVNSQLVYPETAKKDGVQGRVNVEFTINAEGDVCDIKLIDGVRDDLNDEVIRVISASPRWTPGVDAEGKKVPVTFHFPVFFQLR